MPWQGWFMRQLRFKTIQDGLAELDQLQKARSVRTTGLWSEAQIFEHLAFAFEFSISQYPGLVPFVIRKTIGRLVFNRMRKKGFMAPGSPNPAAPKVREEGDAKKALKRLRTAISDFQSHSGSMAEHPFFGTLTKDEYAHLHAMHMADHLAFLEPDAASPEKPVRSGQRPAARKPSRPAKQSARVSKKR